MTADLNEIVQEYLISKRGGAEELRELQKGLCRVPVSLTPFKRYLKAFNGEFCDLIIRAEFKDPSGRLVLLDELIESEKADTITEKMFLPYPRISISGKVFSEHFYRDTRGILGKLIIPNKKDLTSEVLANPNCPFAAIVYKRKKMFHYIEILLINDLL